MNLNLLVEDARIEYESHFNNDLSYDDFWERLRAICAIDDIEREISAGIDTITYSDDKYCLS